MIYADFQNTDVQGRLRLICSGTLQDLKTQDIKLAPGVPLRFYTDDVNIEGKSDPLVVDGIVEYSKAEQCWVAKVDWKQVKHLSESASPGVPPEQQTEFSKLA